MSYCDKFREGVKEGNDENISGWVHGTGTLISLCLFGISLQQLCRSRLSKKPLLKNRLLVSGNTLVLLIVSIILNIYLSPCALNVPRWFVFIVHLCLIFWMCVTFATAYPFLLHGVTAAYKAKRGHGLKAGEKIWVETPWKITVICYEIIIGVFSIVAFATLELWPLKVVFVISYIQGTIACLIAALAIFDIKYSLFTKEIDQKTRKGVSPMDQMLDPQKVITQQERILRLRRGKRIMNIILVMLFILVVALITNLGFILASCWGKKCGNLYSRQIDTTRDYIIYMGVNMFFQVLLIQWTYTTTTGFCPIFLCPNSKYDPDTVCYKYCCHKCVSQDDIRLHMNANKSRELPKRKTPSDKNTKELPRNGTLTNIGNSGFSKESSVSSKLPSTLEMSSNKRKLTVAVTVKIFIYAFDAVITTQEQSLFVNWSLNQIKLLTKKQISSFFREKRIEMLKEHFDELSMSSCLFVYPHSSVSKMTHILKTIGLLEYFVQNKENNLPNIQEETDEIALVVTEDNNNNNSINGNTTNNSNNNNNNFSEEEANGSDKSDKTQKRNSSSSNEVTTSDNIEKTNDNKQIISDDSKSKSKENVYNFEVVNKILNNRILSPDNPVFKERKCSLTQMVLDLVKYGNYNYDEIMYIDHNLDNINFFKNLNSCRTYHVTKLGLTLQDCRNILFRAQGDSRKS